MKLIEKTESSKRYQLLKTRWFTLFLNIISKPDIEPHLHNHPCKSFDIVLQGRYVEQTQDGFKIWKPFMTYKSPVWRFHRIYDLKTKRVMTLSIAKNEAFTEGYIVNNRFVPVDEYKKKNNE